MQTEPEKLTTCNPRNWVKNYADYLYNYAITRINEDELARDLVQETFLAALEKIEKFEGRSNERTWLTAILKNKIIDVYRKKSSALLKQGIIETENDNTQDFFNPDDGHWNDKHRPQAFGIEDFDILGKKEFNQILQRCLSKLPSLWLSVFTMKHLDDESAETICTALKISSSNFWVIIHRAKVNLRSCLQKNWI
ncbi:sigma-70 family RNA polymerase sigma factor [Pedobacter jamesrossensis]|uniref:Sigma-70 family RNA polymerase sigma factor n=1 Tax=Pedobacter jamesrossensis TaxID=1908238 RepID=A0ABV8NJW7_9SPHI